MGARYSKQSGYTIAKRTPTTRATRRTLPQKVGFGPTAAKYLGLGVLAIIALVMLTQQSTRATGAYTENGLRQSISQVNGDVDALQLEAKRAQSLEALQDSAVAKTMQPVGSVTYAETGQVAGATTSAPTPLPSTNPSPTPQQ
jgi:hypothetical protein